MAKFGNPDQRWKVLTSTKVLKDTKFGISEQFPPEIVHRRKELLPMFKEAKRRGLRANRTVDKLYINGRRCYPGDDPFQDLAPRDLTPRELRSSHRPSYANIVRADDRQPSKLPRLEEQGETTA